MPAAWNPFGAVTPPWIGRQEEAIATADPPRDTGCILLDTMALGEPFSQRRIGTQGGIASGSKQRGPLAGRNRVSRSWMRINSPERPSSLAATPPTPCAAAVCAKVQANGAVSTELPWAKSFSGRRSRTSLARATDSPDRAGAFSPRAHSAYPSASRRADDPAAVRSRFGVALQRNLACRLR